MTAIPLAAAAALPSRLRALVAHVMFSGGIAAEAVVHNKLRASLTSLGILFGVASVIAMLAIGNGAEQEILAQMKLLGANNVVITPIVEQKEGKVEKDDGKKQTKKFSPGLSYLGRPGDQAHDSPPSPRRAVRWW
jgi:putative ABC transport system permease protein